MNAKEFITVQILDKSYQIACSMQEAATMQQAVQIVEKHLTATQNNDKQLSGERIGIMAALSIAQELIFCQVQNEKESEEINNRLQLLQEKIKNALPNTVREAV